MRSSTLAPVPPKEQLPPKGACQTHRVSAPPLGRKPNVYVDKAPRECTHTTAECEGLLGTQFRLSKGELGNLIS